MEKPSFMYRWHIGVLVEVLYVYTYYNMPTLSNNYTQSFLSFDQFCFPPPPKNLLLTYPLLPFWVKNIKHFTGAQIRGENLSTQRLAVFPVIHSRVRYLTGLPCMGAWQWMKPKGGPRGPPRPKRDRSTTPRAAEAARASTSDSWGESRRRHVCSSRFFMCKAKSCAFLQFQYAKVSGSSTSGAGQRWSKRAKHQRWPTSNPPSQAADSEKQQREAWLLMSDPCEVMENVPADSQWGLWPGRGPCAEDRTRDLAHVGSEELPHDVSSGSFP